MFRMPQITNTFDPRSITQGYTVGRKQALDIQSREQDQQLGHMLSNNNLSGAANKAFQMGRLDAGLKLSGMHQANQRRAEARQGQLEKEKKDHFARLAYISNTPEKWNSFIGGLEQRGHKIPDQYKGFGSREAVLAEYGDMNMIKSLFKAKEIDPLTQTKIDLNRAKLKNLNKEKSASFDNLSATDKKALYTAEDEIPSLEGAILDLERARELLPKTNTAIAPELRATIGNAIGLDKEASAATTEYAQLMGLQTFQVMSKLLKGAMSDREMAQFQKIIGDTSAPHTVRQNALDRMIGMAKKHLDVKKRRIGELRGKPQQNNYRDDLIKQAREAIAKGANKDLVMQRLQEKLSKGDY